eukprot:13456331-Alexandrium_andersonii.AAC.1
MYSKRTQSATSTEADLQAGSFEPFSIIVQREGGDEAGVRAAKKYIRKCLLLTTQGIMYAGRPLVEYNTWTERW